MTAALILWTHALAALLLGGAALAAWRRERRAIAVALFLTALWALAVAGIDARDVGIDLMTAIRNVGWLVVMAALVRRAHSGHGWLAVLYFVVGAVMAVTAPIAIAAASVDDPRAATALAGARATFGMMGATGALLLLHQIARAPTVRTLAVALGAMWSMDLLVSATDLIAPTMMGIPVLVRGVVMTGIAVLLSAKPPGEAAPAVSRTVALRSIGVIALLLYAGLTAIVAQLAASVLGSHGRIAETAVVIGAATALLTMASTPWLRAWFRVKVAKHLFRHRYDYRVEWQRFTGTLGATGERTLPLAQRTIKALADLVDAPAGLLLLAEGNQLRAGDQWNWTGSAGEGGDMLAAHLLVTGRIVAVGEATDAEAACLPDWLRCDPEAWIVTPLLHADALVGAVVLARPPVERPLDWEDLDLLRVAGRQAASFLAEDRVRVALDEARRFEEFNRRFAFLLHDIKNVASQLTLVARNAERHAENPEFRADMVATLRDSAGRMATLLARLGQHDGARPEPLQPVDIAALVARVVGARRAQHPVAATIAAVPLALAQPARLEQVIGHLVQNAIEASAADCAVRLSVEQVDGKVAIVVADSGVGMSPTFVRDELFRPFASTKPGGFGIGAYEARQLVLGMNGLIDVESREGEGTRFRILLPLATALEKAA